MKFWTLSKKRGGESAEKQKLFIEKRFGHLIGGGGARRSLSNVVFFGLFQRLKYNVKVNLRKLVKFFSSESS